jgi:hypothetical protein
MQRSIAAKYAVRPAARFVGRQTGSRERRLGLRSFGTFQPAPSRPTILRHADLGPYVQLRASWRAIAPARGSRRPPGGPRPAVLMRWSASAARRADRRASAAPAPWRA